MKHEYMPDRALWFNHAVATIKTNDLDPVYEAVRGAAPALGEAKTKRFLVAMNLFYHIGLAAQIAENTDESNFWATMKANYEGTPRGTERRYFRGAQGMRSLDYLEANFKGPCDFVDRMYRANYHDMVKAFGPVPAFGEYFIWKWLDFYDRILGMPIKVEDCYKYVPKEPVKGAKRVAEEMGVEWVDDKKTLELVMRRIEQELQSFGLMAPPDRGRLVGIQEVETNLCMIAHYLNGSDYVGKDILDKHAALDSFEGPIVDALRANLPPKIPVDYFTPPNSVMERFGLKHPKGESPRAQDLSAFYA